MIREIQTHLEKAGLVADITWKDFTVELGRMRDAIASVSRERDNIHQKMDSIKTEFAGVKADWDSPSAVSFDDVQKWLTAVSDELESLLEEMIRRLNQAYNNYHHVEEANTHNMTPNGGPGGNSSHDGHHVHRDAHHVQGDTPSQQRVPFVAGNGHESPPAMLPQHRPS